MAQINNLVKLGFLKKAIMETIVSTYTAGGKPNAAPMGVETEDMQRIIIRPYVSSLTYKNLRARRCAVINVISNPETFYRTAFKEVNPSGQIPTEWFEKAEVVDAPRLRTADAFIEVSVVNAKPVNSERAKVACDVKLIKMLNSTPKPYCRGTFATIEAIIHATRVKTFLSSGNVREAEKLIEFIEHYHALVNKVAPQSAYSEIMNDLSQRIKSWRVKVEGLR